MTEINNRIEKAREIETKEEAEQIGKQMAEKVAKKLKLQPFPQPLSSKWISVTDGLPTGQWNVTHTYLSEEVLIANSCSINIGFYDRNEDRWYVDYPAKKEWIDDITHWMPLPINPHNEVGK